MNKLVLILFALIIFLITGLAVKLMFNLSDDKVVEKDKIVEVKKDEEPIKEEPIKEEVIEEPNKEEPIKEEIVEIDTSKFTDYDSILAIINKNHPLPSDYEPSDLIKPNVKTNKPTNKLRKVAALAIEEMFDAASKEDITLILGSAYRSYSYQKQLFDNYAARDGIKAANKYSAKPGESEHQTGLVADISDKSGKTYLRQSFKDTKEGQWLKDNAYKYGFVMRFLEGKEDITGYMFEPWHFRYIGVDEAKKVFESKLTLEEYYNFY